MFGYVAKKHWLEALKKVMNIFVGFGEMLKC